MTQQYVYTYFDGEEPIYVGMGVGDRQFAHLKRKDKHPFVQRLQNMQANGISPRIECQFVEDRAQATMLEMFLILAYGRKDLHEGTLLNLSNGGEGNSGYRFTIEQQQVQRENMCAVWRNPEHRKARSESIKATQTAEVNARRSKSLVAYCASAIGKEQRSKSQKIAQTTEVRLLKKLAQANPLVKEKQRTSQAQVWTEGKRQEHSLKYQKACTIDGIIIYPSRSALISALGQGANGSRHPNFRYV